MPAFPEASLEQHADNRARRLKALDYSEDILKLHGKAARGAPSGYMVSVRSLFGSFRLPAELRRNIDEAGNRQSAFAGIVRKGFAAFNDA